MRLLCILLAISGFAATSVWALAQNDGSAVSYISPIPSTATPSPTASASVHPYTGTLPSKLEIHCSGLKMSDNYALEIAKAAELLDRTCYGGNKVIIPIRSAMYWINDDTQLYYCNYQWTVQETCSIAEFDEADRHIDIACGEGIGGWVYLPEWGESIGRDPLNPDGSRRQECW